MSFRGDLELKEFSLPKEEMLALQEALIQTSRGDIKLKLFPNDAPNTVANFAYLAQDGFYENLIFHRVIPGFVAQGGCPDGSGTGGPGYRIKCETQGNPHKHKKGTLSMAHAGKDTGGSQFFICFAPQPHLDGMHTVFGQIEDDASLKVLDTLKQGDSIVNIIIQKATDKPITPKPVKASSPIADKINKIKNKLGKLKRKR